jgi:hypothetical protein
MVSDLRYGWKKLRKLASEVGDNLSRLQVGFKKQLMSEAKAFVGDAKAFRCVGSTGMGGGGGGAARQDVMVERPGAIRRAAPPGWGLLPGKQGAGATRRGVPSRAPVVARPLGASPAGGLQARLAGQAHGRPHDLAP